MGLRGAGAGVGVRGLSLGVIAPEFGTTVRGVIEMGIRLGKIVFWASWLVLVLFGLLAYWKGEGLVEESARNRLGLLAASVSRVVPGDVHGSIRSDDDAEGDGYRLVQRALSRFMAENEDVRFAYTYVVSGGKVRFVVDGSQPGDLDGDGVEDQAGLFEEYPEASAAMVRSAERGVLSTELEPTEDKWGRTISAFAPIWDSEGRQVAAVGVDMDFEVFEGQLSGLRGSLAAWVLMAGLAAWYLGRVVTVLTARRQQVLDRLVTREKELAAKNLELSSLAMRMEMEARTDALTGLLNRRGLEEELERLAESRELWTFGLLLMDLDNFKLVNDAHGHQAGDLVLQAAARVLRESEGVHLSARFGGDEFLVLVRTAGPHSGERMGDLASSIQGRLVEPLNFGGHTVYPTSSIGIALGRDGACSPEELMRRADMALHAAKRAGKNQYAVYGSQLDSHLRTRLELESDLRYAIQHGLVWTAWQPIVDLSSGSVVAAEALMRMRRGDGTPVPPSLFIPVAEELGLIRELGARVLAEACEVLGRWAGESDLAGVRLAVNVSAQQLADPSFYDLVERLVASHGVPAGRLTVEVTESMLMERLEEVSGRLERLRSCGVLIALDDFGTGYSSLSMLVKLPIDILKIDRTFVWAIDDDSRGLHLTRSMVSLGRSLGMWVVAEGVERSEQHASLASFGCHYGQGFLYAPGLDLGQIAVAVRSGVGFGAGEPLEDAGLWAGPGLAGRGEVADGTEAA